MRQGAPSMQRPASDGPPPSVFTVAVVQFFGSLPFLYFCGINLWGVVRVTHEYKHSPMLVVVFGLPILFSVIALVTSVGLLRLCEWARRTTLCLATLPVAGCALFLILHHPRDSYGTPFAVRDVSRVIAKVLLLILTPISIWWWVLFTRNTVRSQFRRH
jgi:hypothetical protein